jgi:hypothetical protein
LFVCFFLFPIAKETNKQTKTQDNSIAKEKKQTNKNARQFNSKRKKQTNKISQQPENCENRNDSDLVQAFLKKWWVVIPIYTS